MFMNIAEESGLSLYLMSGYNEPINSDKKIVDSKLDFPYYFNHERRPTYGKETTHTGGESPARA